MNEYFAFIDEHPEKSKQMNEILELLVEIQRSQRSGRRDAGRIKRLQEIFRQYQWIREIIWDDGKPSERMTIKDSDDLVEYDFVHRLLVLANHYPDYLSNIRRCAGGCGMWIIARRKTVDRFCTAPGRNCRQNEYERDPKRIEQHRANMRRLYREWKDKNDRAKYRAAVERGFKGTLEQWRDNVKKTRKAKR